VCPILVGKRFFTTLSSLRSLRLTLFFNRKGHKEKGKTPTKFGHTDTPKVGHTRTTLYRLWYNQSVFPLVLLYGNR